MPTRPDVREVAELWVRGDQRVARKVIEPIAGAIGRGYVAAYDPTTRKASIRKGSRNANATDNFDVSPTLDLRIGDHVQYRELGSDRVVLHPLDRDARTDWNPLTTAGQIIIAGPDGAPTVIEPPADPTIDHVLQWDGDTEQPVWVPV